MIVFRWESGRLQHVGIAADHVWSCDVKAMCCLPWIRTRIVAVVSYRNA
jgi:hypothetical protein